MDYNPVGWFEIPVTDMRRAQMFYETVLGYELKKSENDEYEMLMFPMVNEAYGATGMLIKGMGYTPGGAGPVIYFTCPDIDGILAKVEKAGGRIILPKKDIGEPGHIAWFSDTEGNTIALHERKKA